MKDWTGNIKSTFTTLGASNHTEKEREQNDYYATDPIAIDGLAKAINLPHNVWECACGAGHLSERLKEIGCNVYSSDKIDRGYGEILDFLTSTEMPSGCECIITNPPYKYALEFIEHSLKLLPDDGLCIMFLKTTFLEGQRRYDRLYKSTPPCCNSLRGYFVRRTEIFRECVKVVEVLSPTLGTSLERGIQVIQ